MTTELPFHWEVSQEMIDSQHTERFVCFLPCHIKSENSVKLYDKISDFFQIITGIQQWHEFCHLLHQAFFPSALFKSDEKRRNGELKTHSSFFCGCPVFGNNRTFLTLPDQHGASNLLGVEKESPALFPLSG